MAPEAPEPDAAQARDALVERLFGSILGMIDVYSVYIGDRLGLYRALAAGAATPAEVAVSAGVDERYAREWLEQQAVSGIITLSDGAREPGARRYALPAGHDEVFLDAASPDCLTPFARMMVGMVRSVPAVLDAFRSGDGVPYSEYDADFSEGQGDMNGALFDALLGTEWLPAIPDLDARLRSEPPARVADLACGTGRSSIAIARAYPGVVVDGLDLDEHSINVARRNLAASDGVADRVSFELRDAADPSLAGRYDLVTIFEAVHDLPDPVSVLRAGRGLLADDGFMLVADERVADSFAAPGDEVERVMYGFSILHCLPVGMAEKPSVATGTVLRADRLREYALEAGFSDLVVLPIEHDFWRFYRLVA